MTQAPAVLTGPLDSRGHPSRLAGAVLRLSGWTVRSPGRPAEQGVIPAGPCYFVFRARTVSLTHFIRLTGKVETDFAANADYPGHRAGKRPELASPLRPRSR